MSDNNSKSKPFVFELKEVRIARLCGQCKKHIADYQQINQRTGQVRWLCAQCNNRPSN